MKIAEVTTRVLSAVPERGLAAPLQPPDAPRDGPTLDVDYPLRWRMEPRRIDASINSVLVRIRSDDGLEGIGEAKGDPLPGVIKDYIDRFLAPILIGSDPFHTRVAGDRFRAAVRARGHLEGLHQEAVAGLDIALWDLKGKAAGRPIHDLLGGTYRTAVRTYYSAIPGLQRPGFAADRDRFTVAVREALDRSFTAIKILIGAGRLADVESVKLAREIAGDEVLVLVDALGRYDYTQSLRLVHELAALGVEWLEAPFPPEDFNAYIELSKVSPIPICNDLVWTTGIIADMLGRGARLVVKPEVTKVGITESVRMGELADAFGCPFSPRISIGTAIMFIATAHVSASAPNFLISEFWAGQNPLGDDLLVRPLELVDGSLQVPRGPGLGIELNEATVDRFTATAP